MYINYKNRTRIDRHFSCTPVMMFSRPFEQPLKILILVVVLQENYRYLYSSWILYNVLSSSPFAVHNSKLLFWFISHKHAHTQSFDCRNSNSDSSGLIQRHVSSRFVSSRFVSSHLTVLPSLLFFLLDSLSCRRSRDTWICCWGCNGTCIQ